MNESWQDFLAANWGKVIGGIAGLLLAVMVVVFGFWLTVFIILCVAAGIFLGSRLEKRESVKRIWHRFWPPHDF